jgi:tetratricopeptide (TPR) repeat protein
MSVDQLIHEGRLLFQSGRVPEAIAKWQQALIREPGHAEAQELIRKAKESQKTAPGERTQTLRAFTEGLQDSETSRRLAEDKLKNGILLLQQGRTADALAALEAAHELDPKRQEISRILERAKEQYLLEEKVEGSTRRGSLACSPATTRRR